MPKILVVEDDELLLNMYDHIFTEKGYEVELAADGAVGMEMIKSGRPDVVLVDVVMPKVDGLAMLKQIKTDDELKHIPIVVITSLTDPVIGNTAVADGAALYIQKSEHRPAEVVDLVSGVIHHK